MQRFKDFLVHRHPIASGTVVILIVLSSILLSLGGCHPGSSPTIATPASTTQIADDEPAWFEDVTEKWGFDFVHDPGPVGTYFTPQSMGSGVAVFDFDGDGLL